MMKNITKMKICNRRLTKFFSFISSVLAFLLSGFIRIAPFATANAVAHRQATNFA